MGSSNDQCSYNFNTVDEADMSSPSYQIINVSTYKQYYCSGMQKLTLTLMISPLNLEIKFSTILQHTIPLFTCFLQSKILSSCFWIRAE